MHLEVADGLPFVTVTVRYGGREAIIPRVVVDTGSVSTVLAADAVASIGIQPKPEDRLILLRGVGGTEAVFLRRVDRLSVGPRGLSDFEIEVGGMDYGIEMSGILGLDFLKETGAIIDLDRLELRFGYLTEE